MFFWFVYTKYAQKIIVKAKVILSSIFRLGDKNQTTPKKAIKN